MTTKKKCPVCMKWKPAQEVRESYQFRQEMCLQCEREKKDALIKELQKRRIEDEFRKRNAGL